MGKGFTSDAVRAPVQALGSVLGGRERSPMLLDHPININCTGNLFWGTVEFVEFYSF